MPSFKKVSLIIAIIVALGWLGMWLARLKPHTDTFAAPIQKNSPAPAANPLPAPSAPLAATPEPAPARTAPNPSPIATPAPLAPSPAPLASAAPAAPIASSPSPSSATPEAVAATRRMYNAHASLRSEPVANPDSIENQRILNQMVQKALTNVAAEKAPTR